MTKQNIFVATKPLSGTGSSLQWQTNEKSLGDRDPRLSQVGSQTTPNKKESNPPIWQPLAQSASKELPPGLAWALSKRRNHATTPGRVERTSPKKLFPWFESLRLSILIALCFLFLCLSMISMLPFVYSFPAALWDAHCFISFCEVCEVYNRVLRVEVGPIILVLN